MKSPPPDLSAAPTVLIVEDDERFRMRLARAFEDRGWHAFTSADPTASGQLAADHFPDLAIVDLRLGGLSGIDAVRLIRRADPDAIILLLTGYGSITTAVAAMRAGAHDYLTKPADADQLLAAYERLKRGAASAPPAAAVASLDQVQWDHIHRVLADCDGNISHAARLLGVHRRSLQRKLAKRPLPNP